MEFKEGDTVFHKIMNRRGTVRKIISDDILEVEFEGDHYYWTRIHVDNLENIAGFDDPIGFYQDWDTLYSPEPDVIKKCVCDSRDLFNFGCKCGFFKIGG